MHQFFQVVNYFFRDVYVRSIDPMFFLRTNLFFFTLLFKRIIFFLNPSVFWYGCETWTFINEIKKKGEAMEMWYYRRLLGNEVDRQKNEWVSNIESGIESQQPAALDMPTRNGRRKKNEIIRPCHKTPKVFATNSYDNA